MNIQFDFTETGGLPLDQDILNDLQDGILEAEGALANILGPLVIISGCVVGGGNATNGVVAINGQILPFVGGVITDKVIIVETDQPLTYFDGVARPSQITRIATFGDDGVQNNPWANFVRATSTGVIADIDALESDVATLGADVTAIETDVTDLQTFSLKKLASGSTNIGDADINHTSVGNGTDVEIMIGTTLSTTDYMVIHSVVSHSANNINDMFHQVTVRSKSADRFVMAFREAGTFTQDITLDWVLIEL